MPPWLYAVDRVGVLGTGMGFRGRGDLKSRLLGLGRAAATLWQETRTIAGALRMLRDLEKWGAGRTMLWGPARSKALISQLDAEQGCLGYPWAPMPAPLLKLWRCELGGALRIPEPRARSQPAEKPPPPTLARHQHQTAVLQTGLAPAARRWGGSPDPLLSPEVLHIKAGETQSLPIWRGSEPSAHPN